MYDTKQLIASNALPAVARRAAADQISYSFIRHHQVSSDSIRHHQTPPSQLGA